MSDLAALQEQVRFGARTLQRKLGDIWGHCTARLPPEAGREGFMLAYLRIPFKPVPPDEVYYFDYDGHPLEGRGALPMEIPLYTNVYRARPDVQSVVHVHPRAAVTLSLIGQTVQALHHASARFLTGIPTFPGNMLDNQAIGEAMARALDRHVAILLKSHGAVTVGSDVAHAVSTALLLEDTARMYLAAAAAGPVSPMEPDLLEWFVEHNFAGQDELIWRYLEWEEESGTAPRRR
jgi:L-fuculose-phosphate aldolase